MEMATAELVHPQAAGDQNEDQSENITDIQNYLQSFNREIGESGNTDAQAGQQPTFYAIDASQVCIHTLSPLFFLNSSHMLTAIRIAFYFLHDPGPHLDRKWR